MTDRPLQTFLMQEFVIMLRHFPLIVTGLFVVAGASFAAEKLRMTAAELEDHQSSMMLAKLASSQKITNGLVTKDFEEISQGAKELVRICVATEWAAHKDQIYAHHRIEMQKQAEKLEQMARQKNLEGAAFVYMNSLTTCINCHEYCRDVLRIADDPKKSRVVPIPTHDVEVRLPMDVPVLR